MDENNPNLYSYCANNPLIFTDPTGNAIVGGGYNTQTGEYNPNGIDESAGMGDTNYSMGNWSPTPTLPTLPNFKAPDARLQYENFWANVSDEAFADPETLNTLIRVMSLGINTFGESVMPSFGWGSALSSNQAGPPNHTDAASMNMVKAVQAALGVTVDGEYRTETLQALQMFGFKGLRVGRTVLHTLSDVVNLVYSGGSKAGFILLPMTGEGFDNTIYPGCGNVAHHWGKPAFIKMLYDISKSWHNQHPNSILSFGDLSLKNGGQFDPHHAHKDGMGVDVKLFVDGIQVGSMLLDTYDKGMCQEFVKFIRTNYPQVTQLLFGDPSVKNLTSYSENSLSEHPHHFHLGTPQ